MTPKTAATATLPEGKADHIIWDDTVPGLGLRLRAGGSRAWVFRYRHGGAQRSMKLGPASAITLAAARKSASELVARTHLGQDPAGEKRVARQKEESAFHILAERFLAAKRPELRPSTISEYERHLR